MREKLLFDFGWKFHLGDDYTPMPKTKFPYYYRSKTEREQWGFAARDYNEMNPTCKDKWEDVTLPHDYVIRQKPSEENNNALGYFEYKNAWYKNRFTLGEEDRNKRISILFEGIATHSTVFINGCLMSRSFSGYTSFEVDITDYIKFGEENVISIYVNTSDHEGWWYSGGGIYRHVWMVKTEFVSVDLWGVYINPQKNDDETWNVPIETTVRNDAMSKNAVSVETIIFDADGNEVVETANEIEIDIKDKAILQQSVKVDRPHLWDVENPYLYKAVTIIKENGIEIDRVENTFGFRTIYFDKERGFFLNGKNVKIKGVCCHEDYGITGKAIPDTVKKLRLQKIQSMGANGYRTAHYPHSETTMDLLDELGFLVMAEVRRFESTKEGKEHLEMLLKRDRNHPSVIMWSIGNEEPLHCEEQGKKITETLCAFVKKMDKSRPVTSAVLFYPLKSTVMETVDVIGVNYNIDDVDGTHEMHLDKPFIFSECVASATTRGWYNDTSEIHGCFTAYDNKSYPFANSREYTWKFISDRDWLSGGYQWSGIEYRGETVWPRLCSQTGALDLFLQKKDAFYQNKSHWTDKPMVHILPHWNHSGMEGEVIPVWVYTNCEQVTLYQDGVKLETKSIEKNGHGEWLVEYKSGNITAEGIVGENVVVKEAVETTGKAVKLNLKLENEVIRANGEDVAVVTCYCTDENGKVVPDASPYISFNCNKLGKILGTGSGISDHNPAALPYRKMISGLCSVAVKAGFEAGTLKIYANADGFDTEVLDIFLAECERRPYVQRIPPSINPAG